MTITPNFQHNQCLQNRRFTLIFRCPLLFSFFPVFFFFFKLDHGCGEECAVTNVKENQKTKILYKLHQSLKSFAGVVS